MATPSPSVTNGRWGRSEFRIEALLDEPPELGPAGTDDRGPVGILFVEGGGDRAEE